MAHCPLQVHERSCLLYAAWNGMVGCQEALLSHRSMRLPQDTTQAAGSRSALPFHLPLQYTASACPPSSRRCTLAWQPPDVAAACSMHCLHCLRSRLMRIPPCCAGALQTSSPSLDLRRCTLQRLAATCRQCSPCCSLAPAPLLRSSGARRTACGPWAPPPSTLRLPRATSTSPSSCCRPR